MAKASAQITLHYVVDIQGIYRYYLLQGSTLAKPSKPTSYPPTAWTDTEPAYDTEGTNSLYVVDCTVFADGTFKYSEVSLSTSYEAAKEAYNKAQNVQTTVEQEIADTADTIYSDMSELDNEITTKSQEYVDGVLEGYVTNESYDEFKNDVETELGDLQTATGELGSTINTQSAELEALRDYNNKLDLYVNIDLERNEFVIGREGGDFKTVQTDNSYDMKYKEDNIISLNSLTKSADIPILRVLEKALILGYSIEFDENGNLNCEYIGGE